MSDIIVSQENLQKLLDVQYRFFSFKNKLEHMSPEVKKEFDVLCGAVEDLFDEHHKSEQQEEDKIRDILEKISDEHGFKSIWSIYEIKDMTAIFGYVSSLSYLGEREQVDKEVTYIELWTIADRLITLSGDEHHVFIENFSNYKSNDNNYELQTGS